MAVSTVRPTTRCLPTALRDGLAKTQELLERGVIVVAAPIGDIADAGRPNAIADLSEENARQDVAGRGLASQGNAAVAVDDAEDVFAIGIDRLDERAVAGRRQFVDEHVLNLRTPDRAGSSGSTRS
jgi:hypothetical protein